VNVTFIFTDDNEKQTPDTDEINSYNALAESVRLAAKITDMPCSEMNTDDFLNVF
jgi:hypothetical protein